MGAYEWLQNKVQGLVWGGMDDDAREKVIEKRRDYRRGKQARQLEVRNGADDNVTVNFIGLVVNRAVTMLFGKGVEFDLPGEGDTPQSKYIKATWDANKQEILLHKIALLGAEDGTWYVKMVPDGIVGRDGKTYTRLVPQDPKMVTIKTKPDDIEYVVMYTIRWTGIKDGKETQFKQEIRRKEESDLWEWQDFYQPKGVAKWEPVADPETWEYDFAPMIHCQNLPDPLSPYGEPDVTNDVINLQDKLNFNASNMSKIIRYYAHPKTIFSGVAKSEVADEPGKAIFLPTPDAKGYNLEMVSDLTSSFNYLQFMRQALFSITQTVDITSFADKIGALTNFGLRVLYMDALARLQTKQELYGDALIEINRRLSVIGKVGTDGGEIIWPDVLPVDDAGQTAALEADQRMGIASKQTIATKRNYVWEDEKERIDADKKEDEQNNGNMGQLFLKQFTKGM